jgi:MoaA/NifB/PqqE/SkfB family radical SAM enzyme
MVAKTASEKGAKIINVMPLIPGGRFGRIKAPDATEMGRLYRKCGKYLDVFTACKQCRADAAGIPGNEKCTWEKTAFYLIALFRNGYELSIMWESILVKDKVIKTKHIFMVFNLKMQVI